jgi:hypothetical protein
MPPKTKRAQPLSLPEPAIPFPRVMNGGTVPVQVVAVFSVPSVHPRTRGPWTAEADKIAWLDTATGYDCIIRRNPHSGYLCGYVAVERPHPLYGRQADTLVGYGIAAHEGLSYSASCQVDEPEALSICHVSYLGIAESCRTGTVHMERGIVLHEEAWWFGFSCDGPGDVLPMSIRVPEPSLSGCNDASYKNEHFVHQECIRLAAQLKAIAEGRDPQSVHSESPPRAFNPHRRDG